MTKIEAIERLNQYKSDLAAWMEYGRSMERQLRDAVARAEAALAQHDTPCRWTQTPDGWRELECGGGVMNASTFQFCPRCGHRVQLEPPNRDFTTTGDFRRARGVIPWQPGDEPAETTIRRLRDAPERAESAEAALAAVPWQALLNISHAVAVADSVADSDEAALLAFLNQYAPWVPKG